MTERAQGTLPEDGRKRVAITGVRPAVDSGRFPIKRVVGESVVAEADVLADGHDLLLCSLLYRPDCEAAWVEVPMEPIGNDRWRGEFTVTEIGQYVWTVKAWADAFHTWRRDLGKRVDAGQDVTVDLLVGASLVEKASARAAGEEADRLHALAVGLRGRAALDARVDLAQDEELARLMRRHPDPGLAMIYEPEQAVVVDRERARFGAWYAMFPRSCSPEPGRHGTLRDCEARLPDVAAMGFDVLYLPPIHPIGRTHRKGKNNSPVAGADDPGSPWAIGAAEGGHKAVHPQLGALEDFRRLVTKAREHEIEIALDIAFQCSPDHPYVAEHPEWFRMRPDGTVQYAENPPKKYQDIYPFDFETEAWRELWEELKSIVLFWTEQGVRIFRVDNPHTKPLPFWEWLIAEVKRQHPETIFLSEAFTRPKVMQQLAKIGFTQSYTYFTWRNTKAELTQHLTELTRTEVREYLRPSLWPNTPDILSEYLQLGGRPAFASRLVLAATLGGSYGIYGPAFELCENTPREPGSEEYLGSEKYEVRHWDLARPGSLRDFIARVNRIRRENPALRSDGALRFHPTDNDQLICYSKGDAESENTVVVVVNLDPHHTQRGWLDLPPEALGLGATGTYQMHELLSGARYLWQGPRNYVELDPKVVPAHIFRVRRRLRREHDFEYYL